VRGRRRRREGETRTHLVELETLGLDLVGNREGVAKGRHTPSNLVEAEHDIVRDCAPGQLLLGLLSQRHDLDLLANSLSRLNVPLGGLANTRVDTSAQSTIRGGGDVEDLLDLGFRLSRLRLLKHGVVGRAVGFGVPHRRLRARETGSGNHCSWIASDQQSRRGEGRRGRDRLFMDLVILPVGCVQSSQQLQRRGRKCEQYQLTDVSNGLDAHLEFTEGGLREASRSVTGHGKDRRAWGGPGGRGWPRRTWLP
jgi:hypothetical protein